MAGKQLKGMAEICKSEQRSEATILDWIRNRDYPAEKKTIEGTEIYVASVSKIKGWRKKQSVAALGLKDGSRQKKKVRGAK